MKKKWSQCQLKTKLFSRQSANVHFKCSRDRGSYLQYLDFLLILNPFRILGSEIHLQSEMLCPESDEEEEYVPLLDPRRHRAGNSVSSLSDSQESSA